MNYAYQDYSAWKSGAPVAPSPAPAPQPVGNTSTYTIKQGDNLTSIATRFNTTVAHLASINGIANPNIIMAGQTIKVTGNAPAPAPQSTRTYTVKQNDCLSAIAKQFGVNWMDIANKNGIAGPKYIIHPGQVLKI